MERPEGKFMKGKYWGSEAFRQAADKQADRTEIHTGDTIPNNPEDRIENYLRRFTDIFARPDIDERERGVESLRHLLHRKYLTKPENISDDYIKGVLFGNYAEQKGYNAEQQKDPDIRKSLLEQFRQQTGQDLETYNIPREERDKVIESAIKDQEQRLDSWFSYLTSEEARNYPIAYRYWAFAEMLKLGSYDEERQTYNKRTEDTAAPFPELDQQALAIVLDEINKSQKQETSGLLIEDESKQLEFKRRLQSENFGKLYSFIQEHLKTLRLPLERLPIIKGEWKFFPKGSNPEEVVQVLQGFHTKWCIAGFGTAEQYLSHSDLHIYLSEDKDGHNSIPRACVVNSDERGITEVRGIMSDDISKQHLDDYITPVVSEKLKTLPTGEKWQKQMSDMKQLAQIHVKYRQRETLDTTDLRFLYQMDNAISGTGYDTDPRIKEILEGRDMMVDLPILFDCEPNQISTNPDEITESTIAYIGEWNPEIYETIKNYPNIKYLYEQFPNKKIFLRTIETNPEMQSADQAEQIITTGGHIIYETANDILKKVEFSKELKEYNLVSFSVEQLGFSRGATIEEIYNKAKELGLELCPAEVGPLLRSQYTDQPVGEYLWIAMKSIVDADGDPHVFSVSRDSGASWLLTSWDEPGRQWDFDFRFVFCRK